MINLVLNSILIIYLPFKKAHVRVQGHTVKLKRRFFQGDSKGGSKILQERGRRLRNLHLVNLTFFYKRCNKIVSNSETFWRDTIWAMYDRGSFLGYLGGRPSGSSTQWEDISHLRFAMFVPGDRFSKGMPKKVGNGCSTLCQHVQLFYLMSPMHSSTTLSCVIQLCNRNPIND